MTRQCPIHGEYEDETYHVGPRVITVTTCPMCDIEEQAAEHESIEAMNRRMNIEKEFWYATFYNFNTPTEQLKNALRVVKQLCEGTIKKVVIIGTNGNGKTRLACSALHHVGAGWIATEYEIGIAIRDTFNPGCKRTEKDIVDMLAITPFLVIDELGKSKGSDADDRWKSFVIDKRNSRGLPIMMISNKHERRTCKLGGCFDCIENYLAEDSMDRLAQGGVILRFNGESLRRK